MKLPTAIVIASVIIALTVMGHQQARQYEISQAHIRIETEKILTQIHIDTCLSKADKDYWSYMKVNGKINETTGLITANTSHWDYADKEKQQAIDNCYKK